jgi:hypothetical protein
MKRYVMQEDSKIIAASFIIGELVIIPLITLSENPLQLT